MKWQTLIVFIYREFSRLVLVSVMRPLGLVLSLEAPYHIMTIRVALLHKMAKQTLNVNVVMPCSNYLAVNASPVDAHGLSYICNQSLSGLSDSYTWAEVAHSDMYNVLHQLWDGLLSACHLRYWVYFQPLQFADEVRWMDNKMLPSQCFALQ